MDFLFLPQFFSKSQISNIPHEIPFRWSSNIPPEITQIADNCLRFERKQNYTVQVEAYHVVQGVGYSDFYLLAFDPDTLTCANENSTYQWGWTSTTVFHLGLQSKSIFDCMWILALSAYSSRLVGARNIYHIDPHLKTGSWTIESLRARIRSLSRRSPILQKHSTRNSGVNIGILQL